MAANFGDVVAHFGNLVAPLELCLVHWKRQTTAEAVCSVIVLYVHNVKLKIFVDS